MDAKYVWTIDGSEIAHKHLGRNLPNSPTLGALVAAFPIVDFEHMRETLAQLMSETFSDKIVAANIEALIEGYDTAVSGAVT